MQKSLAVKSLELQEKNEAASAKLRQMVKDQHEAEKQKVQSQEIQAALEKQTVQIAEKREDVMADLAQVTASCLPAFQYSRSTTEQSFFIFSDLFHKKLLVLYVKNFRKGILVSCFHRNLKLSATEIWGSRPSDLMIDSMIGFTPILVYRV